MEKTVNEPSAQLVARILEIKKLADPIEGWLHEQAGANLYQFARFRAPTPIIVELGSWKGRSTIWLASGVKDRGEGRVYAVDTWKGTPGEEAHRDLLKGYGPDQLYEEFLQHLKAAGLLDYVEPIRKNTVEASGAWPVTEKIGLLFIDAGHDYHDVRQDFEFWAPFVAPKGLIVFDDVPSWPGPTRLVSELPRWYVQVAISPNQWIVQKL
jgi:predicted O-methyltransferase YrrM